MGMAVDLNVPTIDDFNKKKDEIQYVIVYECGLLPREVITQF